MEKLYSTEEIAEILNVSLHTVRKWMRERKIEGIKIGRVWRVKESALQRFLEEQSKKST